MENYIINRKQINLEKNQEFAFKIPVLITPSECEFEIEITDVDFESEISVVFKLTRIKSEGENEIELLTIHVANKLTKATFKNLNLQGEFLLISCVSNKSVQLAFSISRSYMRFMG
jgi:hypothetical protein